MSTRLDSLNIAAVWVAIGARWRERVPLSIASFQACHPNVRTVVYSDAQIPSIETTRVKAPKGMSAAAFSRWLKINPDFSLASYILYLDADTFTYKPLDMFAHPLWHGFDLVIAPSINQDNRALTHVSPQERSVTLAEVGNAVQWQAGAFAFTCSDLMQEFFAVWRDEWKRWSLQDQGALMRALARFPLRILSLPQSMNSKSSKVLQHSGAG